MRRISDRIREELATLLVREVTDPRLQGVTVTEVKVDRELAYAEVYVSAVEGQERSQEVLRTLRHAGGFLRTALAERIDLRAFPRLRFHWDLTPEKADHIERLLAEIRAQEPPAASAAEPVETEGGDLEGDEDTVDESWEDDGDANEEKRS
jgi:ribosome-binding factor A